MRNIVVKPYVTLNKRKVYYFKMMKSRVGYTKIIIVKGAFPYLHLWVNKNVRYVNSGDMNTFELNSYLDAWIRKIS